MLIKDTEALAGQILAHIVGGWAASGRPLSNDGQSEAKMAIDYARAFESAVKEARMKPG